MRPHRILAAVLLVATLFSAEPSAQSDPRRKNAKPEPPRTYRGRTIARTMHYLGAPWLIRESREREEECSTLLRCLGIEDGDVVCDFGSGNGFYTLPICRMVGDETKVLAVDIQKQMLDLLELRAKSEGLAGRVEPILGTETDPRLPKNTVDLALLVDVYHELSHPEETLRALRDSLAPGGRIVLVEFREEDPKVPIKKLHKMSKRQVLRELVPNGFRLDEQFDELPWQHVMFFERAPQSELTNAARDAMASISTASRLAMCDTPEVGNELVRAFRLTGDDRYYIAASACGRALADRKRIDAATLLFWLALDDLVEEDWLTKAIARATPRLLQPDLQASSWAELQAIADSRRTPSSTEDRDAAAAALLENIEMKGLDAPAYRRTMRVLCDVLEHTEEFR